MIRIGMIRIGLCAIVARQSRSALAPRRRPMPGRRSTSQRGRTISCGVPTGIPGFGMPDSQGKYAGFDVDICGRFRRRYSATPKRSNTCR